MIKNRPEGTNGEEIMMQTEPRKGDEIAGLAGMEGYLTLLNNPRHVDRCGKDYFIANVIDEGGKIYTVRWDSFPGALKNEDDEVILFDCDVYEIFFGDDECQ